MPFPKPIQIWSKYKIFFFFTWDIHRYSPSLNHKLTRWLVLNPLLNNNGAISRPTKTIYGNSPKPLYSRTVVRANSKHSVNAALFLNELSWNVLHISTQSPLIQTSIRSYKLWWGYYSMCRHYKRRSINNHLQAINF